MNNLVSQTIGVPLFNDVFNIDQSPFDGITPSVIKPIAVVPIGIVSNIPTLSDDDDNSGDVVVNLDTICLTFEDFITLFYYNTGYKFGISPANTLKHPVTFLNKFYNTTPNCKSIFSLYDQFIKAWTKKYNKSAATLSFEKIISLRRLTFLVKGLSDLGIYMQGQSWDEVLAYLIETSNIKPTPKHGCHSEYNNGVPVIFVVQAKVFSPELKVTLIVNFSYSVVIPGFVPGNIITEVLPCKVREKCVAKEKERTFLHECDNSSINSDDLPPSLPSHLVPSNNNCEFTINTMDKNGVEDGSIYECVSNFIDSESYGEKSNGNSTKW